MRTFGLIGYPLAHSFSPTFFEQKFKTENIIDANYQLFELADIQQFPELLYNTPNLRGLNVTIPHKTAIIPFLDELDSSAQKVGAVNVIKIKENRLIGYNTDYYGFFQSLLALIGRQRPKALILGNGGSAQAVKAALNDLDISYKIVSRNAKHKDEITYEQLKHQRLASSHHLIINTTPLGMSPNIEQKPYINYTEVSSKHFLFDLIYNPEKTSFLKEGELKNASIKNGLEMLQLQAEKSWEIWNT